MEEANVPAESQSAEADSEEVAPQAEPQEPAADDVQSSEHSATDTRRDPAPSDDDRQDAAPTSQAEERTEGGSGNQATPDHVSSSSEAYPGLSRTSLPSINHQSVLIPNMEPYLEEGSLDGTPKDFQDPTSSNGNPSGDSETKTGIDSSNQPDTPSLNHDDSSATSLPAASSSHQEDTDNSNPSDPEAHPAPSQPAESENGQIGQSNGSPPVEEEQATAGSSDRPIEEESSPSGGPVVGTCGASEISQDQPGSNDPTSASVEQQADAEVLENGEAASMECEGNDADQVEDGLVSSVTEGEETPQDNAEASSGGPANPADSAASPMEEDEVPVDSAAVVSESNPEEAPMEADETVASTAQADGPEHDGVDSSTFPPAEVETPALAEPEEEHAEAIHDQETDGNAEVQEPQQSQAELENPPPESEEPQQSQAGVDTPPAELEEPQQSQAGIDTPPAELEEPQQSQASDDGSAVESDTIDSTAHAGDSNEEGPEVAEEEAPKTGEADYDAYPAAQSSELASEMVSDEPESQSSELIPTEPATVCEADSSAAGPEEAAYDGQEAMESQNAYAVEDAGEMGLSSVPQTASMTPYHNSESSMLVEMAPLATEDGSYVSNQLQQVQYVEAGQEGMITDAQAAELLMRVSEQRPISLQSLQQDAGASGGPYVQVQAQTVEGITHLVEVPVSALAGYCLPSTLVYSTPGGAGSEGEMASWTVMEAPATGSNGTGQQSQPMRMENKFSDIVSASIEAIGFPESVAPGANILSQAEQLLISSDSSGAHQAASSAGASANNFEFDESSNSSLTLMNEKSTTSTYPRPKRESIESRIHRLLRGANAPVPEGSMDDQPSPGTPGGSAGKTATTPKTVKLAPLQPKSASPAVQAAPSSPATVSLSLPKRPGRLDNASGSNARSVTIPAVFTATNQSANNKRPPLPPGCSDYFMPRGMSKRKAQPFKPSKVNPSKPGCIDADPAPPEETKVKLVMNQDQLDEEEQALRDDDEYNRAVLLQARQRKQTEQVSIRLDSHGLPSKFSSNSSSAAGSPSTVLISLPASMTDEGKPATPPSTDSGMGAPAKRVRLSFPPDKYANLDEEVSSAYMAELQTPKLTYTIPRTRQARSAKAIKQENPSIDTPVKLEPEINVRLPWMDDDEEEEEKKMRRVPAPPPRIIRPAQQPASSRLQEEEDMEQDGDQVIVIGLDETGQQPSEEQLTAIIQAAMTKRETGAAPPDRPVPPPPSKAVPTRPPQQQPAGNAVVKMAPIKRKVEEENGGLVETEENGVRLKVIRTYDRNVTAPRRRPPRSKKLSALGSIEIFDYEDEEEEEEDEEEVDDLERFSQALADEEKAIREKESQSGKDFISPNASGSSRAGRRGRGRSPAAVKSGKGTRGRGGRGAGAKPSPRGGKELADGSASDDEDGNNLAYEDNSEDDDYKPTKGRGRGRGRGRSSSGGRSRGRGRRSSSAGARRVVEEEEEEEEAEEMEDDEEEDMRIPGMPSKPCPGCDERFTTREGFLDHIATHSSAKCLFCDWKTPAAKDKSRLRQHMLGSHSGSIPAASR